MAKELISYDGMGEMCKECKHAVFSWDDSRTSYSFECRKDCGVVWDDDEECEDCDGVEFIRHDWY